MAFFDVTRAMVTVLGNQSARRHDHERRHSPGPRVRRIAASAAALIVAVASATIAFAATPGDPPVQGGIALLLTASAYDGNPLDSHVGCRASAKLIADKLAREKYDIVDANDLSRSEIANAIATFSDKLHAQPQQRPFVYVCGYAGSVGQRIFFLPAFHSTTGALRLETDGILVRQLIDLVADTSGTFIADLDAVPNQPPLDPDVAGLKQGLSPFMRLDVLVHSDRPIGSLGHDYALNGGTPHGSIEEARSVAVLRQAMIGPPATAPVASRPAVMEAAAPPLSLPTPGQKAGKTRHAHDQPRHARHVTVASATPSHRSKQTASRLAAARALAVRQAFYRRQLALYRASQQPNLLDLLLGDTPSAPAKNGRVARLASRSSH